MSQDSFDVSCVVLEISAVEISAFFDLNIMGVNGALNVVLTAAKTTLEKLG